MKVLIADDDPVTRRLLEANLERWGHRAVVARDGAQAWHELAAIDGPQLAIVDWAMPELDGLELCRRIRTLAPQRSLYVILLTARLEREGTVEGLAAGADDYMIKPFDTAELRARLSVGVRVLALQRELARRIDELEEALAQVDHLHGLLPICSYCRKIRRGGDSWQQLEAYVAEHSSVQFSHGICPQCEETVVRPEIEALLRAGSSKLPEEAS